MSTRRPTLTGLVAQSVSSRRFVPVFAVVVFAMLALSAPAFSLLTFPFDEQIAPTIGTFHGAGTGSIAVNDFNGDTYVADQNTGEVNVFNSSGDQLANLGSFGGNISIAANNATGQVYVLDPVDNVVDAFNSVGEYECQITGSSTPSATECNGAAGSATPAGGFAKPNGITVDQATGRIYVVDGNNHAVDIFSAKGAYQSQISLASLPYGIYPELMRAIVVDDFDGNIYLAGNGDPNGLRGERALVYEFNAAGNYSSTFTGSSTPLGEFGGDGLTSVAADNSNGSVYITANYVTYVFDASDKYLTQFGSSNPVGLAVDQANGRIYLSTGEILEVFGPGVQIPDITTASASEIKRQNATLNGTVDPDKAGSATCEFVWGTSTAFGKVAPCSASVAEGSSPVAVHAALTGLQPNTTYYYRLEATNADGTNAGEASQDRQFTTSGPAAVDGESASNVASGSATLDATLTVHNAPTTYYFEYGTSIAYGNQVPISPGTSLGAGENTAEVSQHVQLSSVATLYHYRVVTVSELEVSPGVFESSETDGADQTFTTQAAGEALTLPDGRHWEMVSPPEKRGAQIYAIGQYSDEGGVIQAAAAGGALTYVADGPTEAVPKGYTNLLQVFSARGPDGWESRDIAIPHSSATGISIGAGAEYRMFSEDLSLAAVQPFGNFIPSLSAEASEPTAYQRTNYLNGSADEPCATNCYRPLVTGASGFANVPPGTIFAEGPEGKCSILYCGPQIVGATPDLSQIVISSTVALTSAPAPHGGLYEWTAGRLELISILPGPGSVAGSGPKFGVNSNSQHAISDDGSRIFWSSTEGLFMRDVPRAETVRIGKGEARFEDASPDGSVVFFNGQMCEVKENGTTGELECPVVGLGAKVVGLSQDGSWIYFLSTEVLAPGSVLGGNNLYVRHGGVIRLIASVSTLDAEHLAEFDLTRRTSRVSPNGHWLAFMSSDDLTGYNTRDAVSGKPDEEVYLYNAEAEGGTGRLICASCDPTGARPVGVLYSSEDTLWGGDRVWGEGGGVSIASNIPTWTPYALATALHQARYLSNSGRLFFNSDDPLMPQDVNGAWDVYQYEPPGVGDCSTLKVTYSERSGGCVGLITSGESGEESGFLDASENGSEVFFLTSAKLSSQDRDTALDVYDAHECTTGSPCFTPPPVQPPPCETGDSCKASPTPQPEVFGAPASATFAGVGNLSLPTSKPTPVPKVLTRTQKLARALKACRKKKGKHRTTCVRQAKAKYAAKKSSRVNTKQKGRG